MIASIDRGPTDRCGHTTVRRNAATNATGMRRTPTGVVLPRLLSRAPYEAILVSLARVIFEPRLHEVAMGLSRLFRYALASVALVLLGAPEGFAQDRGVIEGWVFLEGTREPVPGAVVRADPPEFQPDGTVESLAVPVDSDVDEGNGRFSVNWLRSGIWNVTASAESFVDVRLRIEVTQNGSNLCTATQMIRCKAQIEFHMEAVKADAELEVEEFLGEIVLEGQGSSVELEQAKAGLLAADEAYNAADYRTAIAGYEQLMETWPQMAALQEDIGDAYRSLGQFEDALAAYDRFLAGESDNDVIERKIARTRLLAGDLDAAQDLAATGGSASPEDLYNLGEVAFGEGNVAAAADWYEKAVAADPDWEPPVFKLALVALNRGDIEGAKVLFQKVVDLAPNSPEGAQAEATLAALP